MKISDLILTGLGHFLKLLIGFILVKLISYFHGPEKLGELGNLLSFVTFLAIFSGGGVVNGLIKYVSEYKNNNEARRIFVFSSFVYSVVLSIITAIIIFSFAKYLNFLIFGEVKILSIIYLLGVCNVVFAFNNYATGYLNGSGLNSVFSYIQISGAFFCIPILFLLINNGGIYSLSIAIIIAYSFIFFPLIFFVLFCVKREIIRIKIDFDFFDFKECKKLSFFTFMAIASAFCAPLTEIIIRNNIVNDSGYVDAGLWLGIIKISGAYIGLFATFLAFYFIPRVSSAINVINLRGLILKTMFGILFLFSFGAFIFWFFRDFFITILLSADFVVVNDFLHYQLIGDLFRILSYVIGFFVVAKSMTFLYILSEFFQNLIFFCFFKFFYFKSASLENLFVSYCLSYISYFVICMILLYFLLKKESKNDLYC